MRVASVHGKPSLQREGMKRRAAEGEKQEERKSLWVLLPSKSIVRGVGEVGISEQVSEVDGEEVKALPGEEAHTLDRPGRLKFGWGK